MKKQTILTAIALMAIGTGAYWLGAHRDSRPAASADTNSAIAETGSRVISEREFRGILAEPDPIAFRTEYLAAMRNLTAEQVDSFSRILWTTPGELDEIKDRQKLFAYAWGALEGQEAVEFVFSNKSVAKVPALSQAFAGWASRDPQAAKDWIESQLTPAERLLHRWALVDGWARHDPDAASDYVLGMGRMPGRDRLIRSVALEQVRKSPREAASWAAQLPPGSLRTTAVDEIALQWSRVDPQEAVDWAAALKNTGEMKRAVNVAVTEWARMDPAEPGNYLNTLDAGPVKDHATAAWVEVVGFEDLETITEWAGSIQDTALREESLLRIASDWSTRNPQLLAEWLPRSGLSEAAIERLR